MKATEILDPHSRLARWRGLRLIRVLRIFVFLSTMTSVMVIITLNKFKQQPFKDAINGNVTSTISSSVNSIVTSNIVSSSEIKNKERTGAFKSAPSVYSVNSPSLYKSSLTPLELQPPISQIPFLLPFSLYSPFLEMHPSRP